MTAVFDLSSQSALTERRYNKQMPNRGTRYSRSVVVRCLRLALPLLLTLTTAYPLAGAEPVLKDLQPRGGQRGKRFALTLRGEGLATGAELITTLPGAISKLAPPRDLETPDTVLTCMVQLPEDAPVGAYPLRVRTADGLSNVLILSVSDLPEIPEREPNDSISQAQAITVPIAVSGTLKGPDQDYFSFAAKAGERLVLEVEARRIGSAIDPVIEIFDSNGHRIAENDDAPGLGVDSRLELTFPKAGKYYVAVHDAKFSEQGQNFYRLKVGSYSYAEGIFPLGWQRGKSTDITLFGGNLTAPVVVHPDLNVPAGRASTAVNLPGPRPLCSLPFRFRLGDFPEKLAPSDGSVVELAPSTVMNGRILKPGQVDRYRLKVSPGEQWLFDLDAAKLGTSSLYGTLTVYNSEGKKLEAKDVGDGPDPKLAFTVPAKVSEITLGLSDVRGQGGLSYGYRLIATSGAADYSLKILTPYVNVPARGTAAVQVVAERHGYDGPIRLSVPDLPADFAVDGGNIAAEILNYEGKREPSTMGYLTLTAKPDAKPRALELSVWGEGGAPDHPIRRRAEGPGLIFTVNGEEQYNITADLIPPKPTTYGWLGIELPVAISTPVSAVLEVADHNVRAVQGMDYPITYKLTKRSPEIKIKTVRGLDLPTVKDLNLENKDSKDSKSPESGKLVLASTLETPLVKFDLVPSATVEVNGVEQTVLAPAVTVELVRAYSLELNSKRVEFASGSKAALTGTIHREPLFTGTVKISVGDPPDKVSCGAVEIPNDKSEFSLTCEAASGIPPGDSEVHLVSTATIPGRTDKREYTFPPVAARMIITGRKVAQAADSNSR